MLTSRACRGDFPVELLQLSGGVRHGGNDRLQAEVCRMGRKKARKKSKARDGALGRSWLLQEPRLAPAPARALDAGADGGPGATPTYAA